MRTETKAWMLIVLVIAAGFGIVWWVKSDGGSVGGAAASGYVIGDNICSLALNEPANSPDCQAPGGLDDQPAPLADDDTVVCYTPDNIAHKVYVDNALDEEGPTYLAGTVKLFMMQGNTGYVETDTGTSSTSASLSIDVPCDASAKDSFMTATDDDNSGTDFYTTQKWLDPFTERGGVWYGPATVPFHIPANVQGAMSVTCYDNTGTQTDNNITVGSGGSTNDAYLKITEDTDDAAAMGIMLLVDLNKTAFDVSKFELAGVTAGVGVQKASCPSSLDNDTATWDLCYRLTYQNVALQLDRDTRNQYPDEAYLKASIYAQSGVNPINEDVQVRAIDTMPYQDDGATFAWYADCGPLHETGLCWPAEDQSLSNLGIQTGDATEGHHFWTIN